MKKLLTDRGPMVEDVEPDVDPDLPERVRAEQELIDAVRSGITIVDDEEPSSVD